MGGCYASSMFVVCSYVIGMWLTNKDNSVKLLYITTKNVVGPKCLVIMTLKVCSFNVTGIPKSINIKECHAHHLCSLFCNRADESLFMGLEFYKSDGKQIWPLNRQGGRCTVVAMCQWPTFVALYVLVIYSRQTDYLRTLICLYCKTEFSTSYLFILMYYIIFNTGFWFLICRIISTFHLFQFIRSW